MINKISLAILGCGALASVSAKNLVYCMGASPEGFDPALYTGETTFQANAEMVFDRLTDFKPGSTEIIPSLAERWEVSKDGLTYTLHLRKNVAFHSINDFKPTRPFNAADVLFTFDRLMNPKNFAHRWAANYPYADTMDLVKILKSVEKMDDSTVRFQLNKPYAPFTRVLAMSFLSIVSEEYAKKIAATPAKMNQIPIGTGPYMMSRYDKDATIRYKANPNYWDGAQSFDQVIFSIITDGSVAAQKIKAGECQAMKDPKVTEIPMLKANPKLKVSSSPLLSTAYVEINTKTKSLSDPRVRRALAMAMDRKNYIKVIWDGQAQLADSYMPPTMWAYDKNLKMPEYSVAEAKKLLAAAGYPNGFELRLATRTNTGGAFSNSPLLAQMIQSDLAQIGVKVKIESYEFGQMLAKMKGKNFDLSLMAWGSDNGDPDNFMNGQLTCNGIASGENRASWCNKNYDALMETGLRETDPSKREAAYKAAQKILQQDMVRISLAHPYKTIVMQKDIRLEPNALSYTRFKNAR